MVVEVLADAREVGDHVDAEVTKVRCGTNARQHQQLRGVDDAGRQDDLALNAEDVLRPVLLVDDARGAGSLESDSRDEGPGDDAQVRATPNLIRQIGVRRGPAGTGDEERLEAVGHERGGGVHITPGAEAGRAEGCEQQVGQVGGGGQAFDGDRAARAAPL